jgi:hypothetical protein
MGSCYDLASDFDTSVVQCDRGFVVELAFKPHTVARGKTRVPSRAAIDVSGTAITTNSQATIVRFIVVLRLGK